MPSSPINVRTLIREAVREGLAAPGAIAARVVEQIPPRSRTLVLTQIIATLAGPIVTREQAR